MHFLAGLCDQPASIVDAALSGREMAESCKTLPNQGKFQNSTIQQRVARASLECRKRLPYKICILELYRTLIKEIQFHTL